jgi:hypothetical protein
MRSFPRVVVHGPKKFLGMAVPHPYTTQGIQKVLRAVTFSVSIRENRKLFRCSAEALKIEKGINGPLFCHRYSQLSTMITESWWKLLWGFLARYGMSLEDDVPDFPLY